MAVSIRDIKKEYEAAQLESLPSFIGKYSPDPRAGVQALVRRAAKEMEDIAREKERIRNIRSFEIAACGDYLTGGYICGIDEAGRGPLAGPVAAGAVILPADSDILYINDSKKLSEEKREELYERITEEAVSWAVGLVSPQRIDEINILQATYEAMRKAEEQLHPQPEVLVIDAVRIPGIHLPQVPVVKGDAKCYSVGAASILAKVTRDRIMREYDREFPEYGFAGNKGYGSEGHIEALKKYGPSPIHRRTFIGHFIDPASPVRIRPNYRELGTEEENAAAEYLRGQGIHILEHSFRTDRGEIDLIGRDGEGTLIFFEVKYRSNKKFGDPAEAVTSSKQMTICRTSDYYRHIHGIGDEAKIRFDVAAVDENGVRWIKNAFPYRVQ
jgi:ribonuclease HII